MIVIESKSEEDMANQPRDYEVVPSGIESIPTRQAERE
jgi:hypothetical protein